MHLKAIRLTIMLLGIMLVSPILKYQPDLLKSTVSAETETAEQIETTSAAESSAESEPPDEAVSVYLASEEKDVSQETVWKESTEAEPDSRVGTETAIPEEKKIIIEKTETAIEEKAPSAAYETQTETADLPEVPSESEAESPMTEPVSFSADDPMVSTETTAAHLHTWVPVIQVIHHDAVYQTVHHDAQIEQVFVIDRPAYDESYENTYLVGVHDICKGCGLDITASGMTPEEYEAHDIQHILNGEESSFSSRAIYETRIETVHHEAEGHYENRVVQETYDESVLVSEAWDEEIVVEYICEECSVVD